MRPLAQMVLLAVEQHLVAPAIAQIVREDELCGVGSNAGSPKG